MSESWARDEEHAAAREDVAGMSREQLTARLTFVAVELTDDALRELVAASSSLPRRVLRGRPS